MLGEPVTRRAGRRFGKRLAAGRVEGGALLHPQVMLIWEDLQTHTQRHVGTPPHFVLACMFFSPPPVFRSVTLFSLALVALLGGEF